MGWEEMGLSAAGWMGLELAPSGRDELRFAMMVYDSVLRPFRNVRNQQPGFDLQLGIKSIV